MGCKNTKVGMISEFISPHTIDELPVEIIYKILDELDTCTIFVSLYHVCKRFNEILSTYHRYDLNLQKISLTNFGLICSHIRPDQVTKLTLSDDENSPGLIDLFLSRFSMNKFVRLRSLTLIQINNEEHINRILIPIADQTSLFNFSSIKIINTDETYGDIFVELIMSVLTKPSLRNVYFDLSYSRTTSNPLPWLEQCSIRHITFKNTCTVSFVRNIFTYAPQLETFKADDFDFDDEIDLNNAPNNQEDDNNSDTTEEAELELEENENNNENNQEDDNNSDTTEEAELELEENANNNENQLPKKEKFASIESTNHLTSLTLNACATSMSKLEWILQEMLALKRFHLITTAGYDDEAILDGHRWKTLLSNIVKFEFIFSVIISDFSLWDADTCITTFRTPFWIEDKQWFVSLEKYDDQIILYTLPYIDNFYVIKNESSSFEYRSTAIENSVLQVQSMNNVHDLHIYTSYMTKSQIKNTTFPRFSRVTHLFLYGEWPRSKSFLTDIKTYVDLNTVVKLTREERVPTMDFIALLNLMPNLQTIETTTNLLDALNAAKFCHKKCLCSFIINPNNYEDRRFVNIEPFCDMFPRIQHLIIPVDNVDSCHYVLDHLKQDLISVIFRIPVHDSIFDESDNENEDENEEENAPVDLFSEWIKELPEQYCYHKKQRQIHIWLK